MEKVLKKLNIDDFYIKETKQDKHFTRIKDVIPKKEDYNFMADLLQLPETAKKNKYLLVVVDLWTDDFDIEPLKNKTPQNVLKALKTMFGRKYLNKPYASIQTDGGSEFKGIFKEWLYNESILHKVSVKGRHTQMSAVESLNKTLGYLFNGIMNMEEEKTGKTFKNWDLFIDSVRTTLNEHRHTRHKKIKKNKHEIFDIQTEKPKFKIGDIVHYKLDVPQNALGQEQPTQNFRAGDYRWSKDVRKIINIFAYPGKIPHRYYLENKPNVTYTQSQLKSTRNNKNANVSTYQVFKIIDKKKMKNKIYYKVWWKGFRKIKDSTWEPADQLIEDGLIDYIDNYESQL